MRPNLRGCCKDRASAQSDIHVCRPDACCSFTLRRGAGQHFVRRLYRINLICAGGPAGPPHAAACTWVLPTPTSPPTICPPPRNGFPKHFLHIWPWPGTAADRSWPNNLRETYNKCLKAPFGLGRGWRVGRQKPRYYGAVHTMQHHLLIHWSEPLMRRCSHPTVEMRLATSGIARANPPNLLIKRHSAIAVGS